MNMKKRILWITRTAVLTALLIVMQAATASFGNTIITGSVVNLILVLAVMLAGLASGLTVAAISPVVAKLLGIGPLWTLIPFIILGNAVLVGVWHFVGNRDPGRPVFAHGIALIGAAVAKFLTLYLGIVRIAIPYLLNLPEKQAAVVSGMFSIPQLLTALIGGGIALFMLPILKKAVTARGK